MIPAGPGILILWLEKIWGKPSMPWSRATRFLKIRFQAWVVTSSGNQEWSRIISQDRSFFAGFFLWKRVFPPGLSFIFPQDLLLPKSQKFIWNQPILCRKLFLVIQFFTSFLDIPGDPGTEVGYCFAEAFVFVQRRSDAGWNRNFPTGTGIGVWRISQFLTCLLYTSDAADE